MINLPNEDFEVVPAPVPLAVRWDALKPRAIRVRTPLSYAGTALFMILMLFYTVRSASHPSSLSLPLSLARSLALLHTCPTL